MFAVFAAFVLAAGLLHSHSANAYKSYQLKIPNGDRVPNPCEPGGIWKGVGHKLQAGGGSRNPFGLDFSSARHKWTPELCRKDSDGDGRTNGQELGDPDCVWTPGATPAMTTGLCHPGICLSDQPNCNMAARIDCPPAFTCEAMNEVGVNVKNVTISPKTSVPAQETTYVCQAIDLSKMAPGQEFHIIGSRPIIGNDNVLHHMIMYSCSQKPEEKYFDQPQNCFMSGSHDCLEMMNLWTYGIDGECFNNNAGFLVGGRGTQFAMLQLHWNNPTKHKGYTDSSGFSLYFTTKLRAEHMGIMMYGDMNFALPPSQNPISVNHTCPGACTKRFHNRTRYITAAAIHMHNYGIRGRISLWRNGSLMKELLPLHGYNYTSPKMMIFDPPIQYDKGDEVKTECYFNTVSSNKSIFWGYGTQDEMCFSFLLYYPNDVQLKGFEKLSLCAAEAGINLCQYDYNLGTHIEQECNITALKDTATTTKLLSEMTANKCFAKPGCHPTCRSYLTNTLWPSNACYDPKRARQMALRMTAENTPYFQIEKRVREGVREALYGQLFCEQEISMLHEMARMAEAAAPTALPAAQVTSGLSSEHLLIVIVVCSCLGFILGMAALAVLAVKLVKGSAAASVGSFGLEIMKPQK